MTTAPRGARELPNFGRLEDFYSTFDSILFYFDAVSGEAARYIAPPEEWELLDGHFRGWIEHLSPDERAEALPEWMDGCAVIGEEPSTGNYLLMPTSGAEAGSVYLFDHDGFEFIRQADDLVHYTEQNLAPHNRMLVEMATNLRFVEPDSDAQWWIRELRDNLGNVANTD